jgi:hypothetical protein
VAAALPPAASVLGRKYDKETAYVSYMNPESGFRAGPGDSYGAA